jgi:hypothetical protein
VSDQTRHGARVDGRFTFTCASCGGVAATLAILLEDREVDGGALPGGERLRWRPQPPSYRLEFVNVTTGGASTGLVALLSDDVVDPLVLRGLDWELAGFCCDSCELNYCAKCWSTWVEFDEGFFDCMRGRCPQGHEQMLDD